MICLCCFFYNCSKYKVDVISLFFLGIYILGQGVVVGTYAFHFMGHFRSKVMDESLKYMYAEALRWKLGHAPLDF